MGRSHTAVLIRGKGDRERRVPIPPGLVRRLLRYADTARRSDVDDDCIFVAKRRSSSGDLEPIQGSGIAQIVRWTAREAGMKKPVHPHLFRHSWMTEMLRRGMSPIQLSFIAGASQEVIAQHYAHLNLDDANDAILKAWTRNPASRET